MSSIASNSASVTTTGSSETSNLRAITTGAGPGDAAVTPDGSLALVADSDGTLTVIDLRASPVTRLANITVGPANLENVAIAPDSTTAYVTNSQNNTVTPVDLTARPPVARPAVHLAAQPGTIAVAPDGATAWVLTVTGPALAQTASLVPIDLTASPAKPGTPIPVHKNVAAIYRADFVLSPDGSAAYVILADPALLVEVPLSGGTIVSAPVGGFPFGVTVAPNGSTVYVADTQNAAIYPVKPSRTKLIVGTPFHMPGGPLDGANGFPYAMAISPDGRQLYVTDGGSPIANALGQGNTVAVFDIGVSTTAPQLIRKLVVGIDPRSVAITPPIPPPTGNGASSIATSLPTPLQAFSNPVLVAASVAVATGGILFITFPAHLFNLTFEENYAAISGWIQRRRLLRYVSRRTRSEHDHSAEKPGRRRRLITFVAVVVLAAVFGSLLDPGFGANVTTVNTAIAIALAVIAGIAVRALVLGAYHRVRHGEARWRFYALPLGLVVALVCVLVSRLTTFQPGYLYGVVCGVVFARRLTDCEEGEATELSALAVLAVSVLAWLLWLPVKDPATRPGAFAGLVILDDLLAAIVIGGLVGSVIGLLPLRFLPGGVLVRWHRRAAWLPTFALALFLVVDVLVITPQSSSGNKAPLITTLLLFIVFGGSSVLFREYFARRWRRDHGVTLVGVRSFLRDLVSAHPGVGVSKAGTEPLDVEGRRIVEQKITPR